jgi:hypothetical protein
MIALSLLGLITTLVCSVQSQQCPEDLPSSFNNVPLIFKRPNLPDRRFKIYTPEDYDPSVPSKLTLQFHGWCGRGNVFEDLQELADEYNYIVVSPTGLKSGFFECNSWQHYGGNTGLDPTGTEPTCDTSLDIPGLCYSSCRPCENRCPWVHCVDDDIDFVRDLILGGNGFENALEDLVCFDPSKVHVMGTSNGGMFSWTLAQDERTAPLIAAGAPIIGTPQCGYDFAAPTTQTPMVTFMGMSDDIVPPTNLPFPGEPADACIPSRDGNGFLYVPGPKIMSTWAKAGPDSCSDNVIDDAFPSTTFDFPNFICSTWCEGDTPYAVDCYFDNGHIEPRYALDGAFRFFELHSN